MAAFKRYRDASRTDQGYAPFELLEQIGRAGHFAIVERWSDAKTFDAHAVSAHMKQFMDALNPIRTSGYDQRPYKTLSVAPASAASGQAIHVVTHVDAIPNTGDPVGLLTRLAETSRKETGNLRFDVLQSSTRVNHFTIAEAWQSQQALDAHAAVAHTRQHRDVLQPIAGGPLDERVYKAVE